MNKKTETNKIDIDKIIQNEGISGEEINIFQRWVNLQVGEYIRGVLTLVDKITLKKYDKEMLYGLFDNGKEQFKMLFTAQLKKAFDDGKIQIGDKLLIIRIEDGKSKNKTKVRQYKIFRINQ